MFEGENDLLFSQVIYLTVMFFKYQTRQNGFYSLYCNLWLSFYGHFETKNESPPPKKGEGNFPMTKEIGTYYITIKPYFCTDYLKPKQGSIS